MNRSMMMTLLVLLTTMLAVGAFAQDAESETNGGNGQGVMGFVDEDGDGFNDLAPDADGDGIPNGLDEDYVAPENGAGMMKRWGQDDIFGGSFGAEAQGNLYRYEVNSHFGTGDHMGPFEGTAFGPHDGEGEIPDEEPTGDQTQQRGDG